MSRPVHLTPLPYTEVIDKSYPGEGVFSGYLLEGKRVKGTFKYNNGDIYYGGWLNKQKHYFGTYIWATG
jgi:hypothetical protein